nr:zinc knuckle CX2CX4HX4C [Tanacetum cinerariifolium]
MEQSLYNDTRRTERREEGIDPGNNGMRDIDGFVEDYVSDNDDSEQDECIDVNKEDKGKFMQQDSGNTVNKDDDKTGEEGDSSKSNNMSYANMVKKDNVPKLLNYIPTLTTDTGNELVIFDEMLVKKGSERWNLTVYGNNEGLNAVLEKGPWMVRNKPLFLQKWCSDIGMERMEPKKFPIWEKIVNVPLEAWSMEGINALASSLGKPIMMDTMTANMCQKGVGNFKYARVLVEVDVEKEIKREIKIQYRGQNNNIKGSKKLKVVYDWKPPVCTKCKVFGHEDRHCMKRK